MRYRWSTSRPASSRVVLNSLMSAFLAASIPSVSAISDTLFVLTLFLSIPSTSKTLERLEPVV
jgi:hypothetical protein